MSVDRGIIQLKESLSSRFATLVYNGFWYGEECQLLLSMLKNASEKVTGRVKLKLYKGNVLPVGRWSPNSLYQEDVASMEDDKGAYNQDDATGFIRLNALPLSTASIVHKSYSAKKK